MPSLAAKKRRHSALSYAYAEPKILACTRIMPNVYLKKDEDFECLSFCLL